MPAKPAAARFAVVLAAMFFGVLMLAAQSGRSQDAVEYRVTLLNRIHHEARVEVIFRNVGKRPLEVVMSRSSPGRYALHEFAKNVYEVAAADGRGLPLTVELATPYSWTIAGHDGTVLFAYTLFGDRADGTYVQIDETHAHLNPPASFVWARGLEQREIRLRLEVPEGWRISSQLPAEREPNTLRAPSLAYFFDSPVEASDHRVFEWPVATIATGRGDAQILRVALHHLGNDTEARSFVERTQRIVLEARAIFGEMPRFDFGTYTFLADYLPWGEGDGMEHRNSTVLTSSGALATSEVALLGTVAHEFFHAWNMERLRPRDLEPFDFESFNLTSELWFGEGFTSYFDDLLLVRAGVITLEDFAERMGSLIEAATLSPARRFGSPQDMSRWATFADGASWVDPTNRENTFLSYYTYGAALGLALDLELRQRGSSLDDFMRRLWRRYGRSEEGYRAADLRDVLERTSGDPAWAKAFFSRFVEGSELPNYAALLAAAGLRLQAAVPGKPFLTRSALADTGEGVLVQSSLLGEPTYRSGIGKGDVILSAQGVAVSNSAGLNEQIDRHAVGETVRLRVRQRGVVREIDVILQEDPRLLVKPVESLGQSPSAAAAAFRASWLDGRDQSALPAPRVF